MMADNEVIVKWVVLFFLIERWNSDLWLANENDVERELVGDWDLFQRLRAPSQAKEIDRAVKLFAIISASIQNRSKPS